LFEVSNKRLTMRNNKYLHINSINFSRDIASLIKTEVTISEKIEIARWFGRFLAKNFISIYAYDEIEKYLAELVFSQSDKFQISILPEKEVAIIATTLYKHGGHTRMIEVSMDCVNDVEEIIITQESNSDCDVISKIGSTKKVNSIEGDCSSSIDRIANIYLALKNYKKLVLYINPDDIECAIAINIDKLINKDVRKYFFVNHSDHTFSYGRTMSSMILEVSNYGWALDQRNGLIEKQSFLGVPITPANKIVKENLVDRKYVILGGAAYKFKNIGEFSLENYLDEVLKTDSKLVVYVIGPNYFTSPWLIKTKLKFTSRFFCKTRMGYDDYRKILQMASVYVDSYPVTGGTAFTEALLNDIPVIGVSGCPSGYGYADQLRVTTKIEFKNEINKMLACDPSQIKRHEVLRSHAIDFHGVDAFKDRINNILENMECLEQKEFSKDTELDFDYTDAFLTRRYVYCPAFESGSLKISALIMVAGLKNKLGVMFALSITARTLLAMIKVLK
jgi:hypothetical protein